MKNLTLAFVLILSILFACDKEESPTKDISYMVINKTITGQHPDTIMGVVYYIDQSDSNSIKVFLKQEITGIGGGALLYHFQSETNNALVISEGQNISENLFYGFIDSLNLDSFAGLGEKYIAFTTDASNSLGYTAIKYCWMKIHLSADKSTLRIIDIAFNETYNMPIKAGEIE